MTHTAPLLLLTLAALTLRCARSHGAMVQPRQRGALHASRFVPTTLDSSAPRDYYPHFPAGVKTATPGAGKLSQEIAAGERGWYPYDPYDPLFTWRAGVCGDTVTGAQHHLKGGQFYHGGEIVQRYREGATVGIGLSIVAHHNGFIEAHLCDVSKCPGGDISKECFLSGACLQLNRAANAECDSGTSTKCGPIDRNYPGRWYLPCSHIGSPQGFDSFAPEYATFQLPSNFFCEHCVLQWYWAAANGCNPPGVLDYFDGPDAPDWQQCPGQGDARGGVTRNKQPCGGTQHFAEEYYQCADIQITPLSGGRSGAVSALDLQLDAAPTPLPFDEGDGRRFPRPAPFGGGVVSALLLWADNIPSRALSDGSVVDISVYKTVGLQAVLHGGDATATTVQFFVDGELVFTGTTAPFFLLGGGARPAYWRDVPVNRPVAIAAVANGERAEVTVTFRR